MNKNTLYIVGALGIGALAFFYFRKPKSETSTADNGIEKSIDSPQGATKSMPQSTQPTAISKGQAIQNRPTLQAQAAQLFPMPENASAEEATRVSDERRAWIRQNMKAVRSGKTGVKVSAKAIGSPDTTIGEEDAKFAFNGIVF